MPPVENRRGLTAEPPLALVSITLIESTDLKILLISINYAPEPTGIGPYVTSLARGLHRLGHQVEVITGIPHYPSWTNESGFSKLFQRENDRGVGVLRLRHYVPPGGIGARRLLMEASFAFGVLFGPWRSPDVVVAVSPPLLAAGAVVLRTRFFGDGASRIVIWTQDLYTRGMQELSSGSEGAASVAALVEGGVLRAADSVIVIDDRFRAFVEDQLHVSPGRISVHRNWVHLRRPTMQISRERMREVLGWGERPVALHAGSMGEKQGLEILIEAARQAQRSGDETLFVLMGQGSQRSKIQALGAGCPNLMVLDPLPDAQFQAALAAADILLVCERPGVKEMALPSKLTSYFMAGRPVVASTHPEGTTAHLLREAGAGQLVQPGDASGILEAVSSMVGSLRADELGRAGRAFAEAHMLEEAAVAAMEQRITGEPTTRAGRARVAAALLPTAVVVIATIAVFMRGHRTQ